MRIDRKTAKIVGTGHQFRPNVEKASGVPVSTEIFVDEEYCGISGVLHSSAYLDMTKPPLSLDFVLVHNPLAQRRLQRGSLPAAREYQATSTDEGYEIECYGGTLSATE